jgi:HK97 family phage portal protein
MPYLPRSMSLSLFQRDTDPALDESLWAGIGFGVTSAAGVEVNQYTALSASALLACSTILSEDVAKLRPRLWRRRDDGGRVEAKDHWLYRLLRKPNDWQSGFEFREMLMLALVLRGNAYAVIVRNGRGIPTRFVPVNPDWVALYEAPGGELFYYVTPNGLHMRAELVGTEFLIPAEDVLHLRGFSLNGLLGSSRITLAKEAIGLALAQERQSAQWMGNNSRPSGLLTTDQRLDDRAAKRMAEDWKKIHGGPQNAGKVAVLEQGLKFQAMSLSASDMEFLESRKFQVEEIARIFRVPLHMIGSLDRSTNNNIAQQAQEYANYTLTGYTERIAAKLDTHFDLDDEGLFVEWDFSILTRADIATRYNSYRAGVMSMFLTPNEARLDDGRDPMEGGDKLYQPQNMAAAGSQSTGTAPDGAGRPTSDQADGLGNL